MDADGAGLNEQWGHAIGRLCPLHPITLFRQSPTSDNVLRTEASVGIVLIAV